MGPDIVKNNQKPNRCFVCPVMPELRKYAGRSRNETGVGRHLGFTLLEVVVAMAVIAFALAAIIQTTGGFISNQAYLRDRTLAHWVARNALTESQLTGDWPSVGDRSGTAEFAGHEWDWIIKVTQTDEEDMRRLDIEVRRLDQEGSSLAMLSGFVKKPL